MEFTTQSALGSGAFANQCQPRTFPVWSLRRRHADILDHPPSLNSWEVGLSLILAKMVAVRSVPIQLLFGSDTPVDSSDVAYDQAQNRVNRGGIRRRGTT